MGFCYTNKGQLVCDHCGNHVGVEKRHCPHHWCPPVALCPKCWEELKGEIAQYHLDHNCEQRHADFVAQQVRERELRARGVPVRCSALGYLEGTVHVLFALLDSTVGFFMSPETYHAIPLGETATPDDYRKFGELLPAPDRFDFQRA